MPDDIQRFTLPLDQLRFGHESEPPINVRVVGRADGAAELGASITAHGLIQALSVQQIDGHWYVADGNRRLAALHLLAEQGTIPQDWPVKCDPLTGSQTPDEISLAANFERMPLHEADQYAKFQELTGRGLSDTQVAQRFGLAPKRVRRMLALGGLSQTVLDWWRDQEADSRVVDIVRAMTLAPSIDEQERIFQQLKKSGQLSGWKIREVLGAGDRNAARLLKFVGTKAYNAAGGSVIEDLFGEDNAISDPALVARLAEEKLRAKADELLAEGWSWTALDRELPSGWSWSWQKLSLSKKSASEADKARSGAVVSVDHDGKLAVTYGVIKPQEKTAAKNAGKGGDGASAPASISNALSERLSEQATLALRDALAQDGHAGLAALLAGFAARGSAEGPVKVKHEGHGRPLYVSADDSETFSAAFDRFRVMSDAELIAAAAGVAAEALDLTSFAVNSRGYRQGARTLADALDGNAMYVAQRERCDFEDYFSSAPKAIILKAITEAINEDEARKASALKKAELAAFALKNVVPTGWLPPELRTRCYPKGTIDEHGELVTDAP